MLIKESLRVTAPLSPYPRPNPPTLNYFGKWMKQVSFLSAGLIRDFERESKILPPSGNTWARLKVDMEHFLFCPSRRSDLSG